MLELAVVNVVKPLLNDQLVTKFRPYGPISTFDRLGGSGLAVVNEPVMRILVV